MPKAELGYNVWLEVEGEVVLSRWRVALLEAVRATGSISGAAERQGVHFRIAWKKIREMEERLGVKLVEGHAGGSGGGGAALTPEAEVLVERFGRFTEGLEQELERRRAECFAGLVNDL